MDKYLTILVIKHLNFEVERMTATEQEIFPRQKMLIESIKSLCCLIKNKAKQRLEEEEVIRNKKLVNIARNVEEATIEAARWMFALREKRSDFKQFQRNVEIDEKAAELAKKGIEEYSKKILTTETAKFSSAMSVVNLETDTRKNCIETEMQLFDFRLKSVNEIRWWEKNDLRNARYKARKRCLDELVKYDNVIRELYANKMTLLTEKDFVEKEYMITQDQLIEQRSLYKRLKKEYELNRREAFLMELKHFRRNRAAKIIQRRWRIYYAHMSLKKKRKNRK
ncbi:hypothetical protein ANTQUA_LOCUS6011 [Anthophora quadrimaculata]